MAVEEVGVRLVADGEQAIKTVKSLKTELREAQEEVVSLSRKFGATSKEAAMAAKKAALLKDEIADARQLSDAFHPDEKFKALGQTLQVAAGGFAAIQGAQALFGSESEALEKTLLKVQAAMALTQGVNAVIGNTEAFKNLALVIKTNVVSSLVTLRGALIATGIGALAVGVGLLIANFDKVKTVILNLIPGLKVVANFIGGLVEKFKSFVGIPTKAEEEAAKQAELSKERYKKALDETKEKIKNHEAEVLAKKKEAAANQKRLDEQRLADAKKLQEDLMALDRELTLSNKNEFDKRRFELKEWYDKNLALVTKGGGDVLALNAEFRKRQGVITDEENKKEEEERIKKEEERVKENEAQLANVSERIKGVTDRMVAAREEDTKNAEENSEAQKRIDKSNLDAKIQTQNALIGALGTFSALAGRQTAFGKTLAVADATINTYLAASQVLSSKSPTFIINPFARFVAAAATIAQGLVNVRNILKVQVPGGGGGGAVPTSGAITPPKLPDAQPQTTRIDQSQVNQIGNATVRAFVVEADMTNNQEKIRRLNRAARLG
jgi:hypothetical protein